MPQCGSVPPRATLSVQYLGVLPTALAFTTWAFALARSTAGRMAAAIYAIPGTEITRLWQPGRGASPRREPVPCRPG
jgi:hypothetical protein